MLRFMRASRFAISWQARTAESEPERMDLEMAETMSPSKAALTLERLPQQIADAPFAPADWDLVYPFMDSYDDLQIALVLKKPKPYAL